ncbi:SDR family oxidoreductase (plasmid) [Streptomyces sp. BI20]|uniref:SDR family oxidoreductase n=1 Tax=Streptomyces sp. BI20 TaxID=3403460 RepID=UPI003C73D9C5
MSVSVLPASGGESARPVAVAAAAGRDAGPPFAEGSGTGPEPAPFAARLPASSASFAGTTVLIAGGGSGIGLATARMLAGLGARPALLGRDEARLGIAADWLAASVPGAEVRTYRADVRDEERLGQVLDELGTVDHVLVTAGTVAGGPLATAPREHVADSVEGRLWGGYAVARTAAPRLGPGSSLTYLSGIYVVRPVAHGSAVIAAAAATEGLTRALAVELAPRRIRVNAVRAGSVDTPMLRRRLLAAVAEHPAPAAHGAHDDPLTPGGAAGDAAVALAGRTMPLGRYGTAEEVASAAVFLMANAYVTGTVVTVDGGQSLMG